MKLGIVARADDRGIANQTWEAARHLNPERVLVVREPGSERLGFPFHPDRFPDATVIDFDATNGRLPKSVAREWLSGLDVVYIVETPYDWQFPSWAKQQRVATVIHANPEFYRHAGDPNLAHPSVWWVATDWLIERMPITTHLVPMPVAADRITRTARHNEQRLDVLCSVGHQAARDRTGVELVMDAARAYAPEVHVTIRCQDRRLKHHRMSRSPRLTIEPGGQPDYWNMYANFDALVMPRRYGGLSLPVNEACAAGLAVAMSACPPNPQTWPIVPLLGREAGRPFRSQIGLIPCFNVTPREIADALNRLVDPTIRHEQQDASLGWAERHSWEALLPRWTMELEHAANTMPTR